jgi:hypothetical protein
MAKTDFTKDWGDTYNKANVAFTKELQALKKTNKPAGEVMSDELALPQKPLGLLGALVAVDKVDLAKGSPKELAALPGNIKLFKAALAKLDTEQKKLVKDLERLQKLSITMKDKNGLNVPTRIKDFMPETYRQLKLMQTEIQAIYARAANALAGAENDAKITKINDEKNQAKDKVKGMSDADEQKRAAITAEASMKQFQLAFGTSFKSSMAKGAAVIQRIKAKPDLATYNKEMNDGGRDISQNLVNLAKLKADAKFKTSPLAKKLPDPGSMATDLVPFANGAKRNLPNNATPDQIKAALTEFTAIYKRIAVAYADVISGKIK